MKDETGEVDLKDFTFVSNLLDSKVNSILEATDSTEPPVFYLTASEDLIEKLNKKKEDKLQYIPNFRDAKAITKPYKGKRSGDKPYHFDNLTHHILNQYNTKLAIGIEADDLICIDHRLDPDHTIICTRDKDLKMVPGFHYGWPLGNRPGFGPKKIDELGYLEEPAKGKMIGGGTKFFYAQLLMGDTVDNIPGLPKCGPVKAYKLLNDCDSIDGLKQIVMSTYEEHFVDTETNWKDYFNEQASLLWIIRELDSEGKPVEYEYIG